MQGVSEGVRHRPSPSSVIEAVRASSVEDILDAASEARPLSVEVRVVLGFDVGRRRQHDHPRLRRDSRATGTAMRSNSPRSLQASQHLVDLAAPLHIRLVTKSE